MGTVAQLAVAAVAYAVVAAVAWRSPSVLRSASPVVVGLCAAVAVVASLVASGASTEVGGYDAVLRVVVGLAFVAAGCYATARPRLVAAAVLLVASLLGSGAAWPAAAAFGVSAALVLLGVDGPAVGAVVGLALGQAALRLDWPEPTGTTLLLGVVALAIVTGSALGHVHRRSRRRIAVATGVLGAALVVVGGAWAVATWSARGDLRDAVDVARSGLDAARAGDTAAAARRFDRARRLFDEAEGRLGSWWARPIDVVPVAAQNAKALRVATRAGRELATAGSTMARRADPERIRPVDGVVPLEEVRALGAPLAEATAAMQHARGELARLTSPWLVAPLADELSELDEKLVRGLDDARTARLAISVVPGLLGGEGERRYLVVFQTPAEQRANGGVIGNFAEVTYRDGVIELTRNARDSDYREGNPGVARTLTGPDDYVRRYAAYAPEDVIQNVTLSPDFPSVAEVLEAAYPQSGGAPVDGVISMDPVALAEFLRLTGDVDVPGFGVTLTADTTADVLLRDQYEMFPDPGVRAEFLKAAVAEVFARLRATELPGPQRFGEVLGPMVREGRLQIHSRDPEEQRFLRRIGADGAFPSVGSRDFLGVATQNSAGNKIDVFQRRTVRYDATVDPATGAITARATVVVRNEAPAAGLPDYVIGSFPDNPLPRGTSRVMLSLYSPHALRGATIDGEPVTLLEDEELGRNVYTAQLLIPPGGARAVVVELAGQVDLGDDGGRYRLRLWHQATVEPDRARIRVAATPGWTVEPVRGLRAGRDGAVGRVTLEEDVTVAADFRR